jgi:hypothetical protein
MSGPRSAQNALRLPYGIPILNMFRLADAKIVERWTPERSLDVAPDRRFADLELGGADCAAVAQRAEFGQ